MKIPLCVPPADDDAIRDQILKLFSQSSSDTETHRETAMCYLGDFWKTPTSPRVAAWTTLVERLTVPRRTIRRCQSQST